MKASYWSVVQSVVWTDTATDTYRNISIQRFSKHLKTLNRAVKKYIQIIQNSKQSRFES